MAKEFFEGSDIPWASFHTFRREAGTVNLKTPPEEEPDDEDQVPELDETLTGMDYIPYTPQNAEEFFAQIEQWNDEEAKRAYEAAGGKPAFTGSAAEGAQNGGIAISFADPTKAAKTGDTDAANVAVAAGVADDTDVEPDVTKGEQA